MSARPPSAIRRRFGLVAGVVSLLAVATASGAGAPITTTAAREAFLERLGRALGQADAFEERYEGSVEGAASALAALEAELAALRRAATGPPAGRDPAGNARSVELLVRRVCDAEMQLPLGIREHGYGDGWDAFRDWGRAVHDALREDPVANVYRWYGNYDFEAALDAWDAFAEQLYDGRAAAIRRTCAGLEQEAFPRMRALAARLDAANRQALDLIEQAQEVDRRGRAAADASDAAALEAARAEMARLTAAMRSLREAGDAALAEMNREGREIAAASRRAAATVRAETMARLRRLEALRVPQRGRIDRGRTTPKEIAVETGDTVAVTLRGSGLPRGLELSEIGSPRGLVPLAVSGGGAALELVFRKGPELATGRHALDIAGERVSFRYREPRADEPAPEMPLIARDEPAPAPADVEITEDGRGTDLTPLALRHLPQEPYGYWQYDADTKADAELPEQVFRIAPDRAGDDLLLMVRDTPAVRETGLAPHLRVRREEISGVIGQYGLGSPGCVRGLRTTKERTPDACAAFRWWEPSTLCIDRATGRRAEETVTGRPHDRERCEIEDGAYELRIGYARFVGLSFAAFVPGKYIHLVASAAPARYRAAVRLTWDYRPVEARRLELTIRPEAGSGAILHRESLDASGAAGSHEFVADRSGIYHAQMVVLGDGGTVLHRDRARVIIPTIPGLGG